MRELIRWEERELCLSLLRVGVGFWVEWARLRAVVQLDHHQPEDEALALALEQGRLPRREPRATEYAQNELYDSRSVLGNAVGGMCREKRHDSGMSHEQAPERSRQSAHLLTPIAFVLDRQIELLEGALDHPCEQTFLAVDVAVERHRRHVQVARDPAWLIAFRSLVVAVVSILLNLLSVGAAYGLLTLVFLKGVGAVLFGFEHATAVDAWVPLFLFSVLFGLSMDYQVFLMSRIKERYDESGSAQEVVSWGVVSTARIITGAALIIVVVFAGFARGQMVAFQQMGFGVAVALLLDATIIRSVVLPSAMSLLGRVGWYLPSWLEWLPRLEVERREMVPVTEAEGSTG